MSADEANKSSPPTQVGALSEGLGPGPERATCERCDFMLAATREAQAFAAHYSDEVLELREQLARVRQALPEEWRGSVPSVAVATLAAELDTLRQRFYTTRCPAAHLCDCQEAGKDCARGYKKA